MSEFVGMDPEKVRAKVSILRVQLAVLDRAATSVEQAATASLNPFAYGITVGAPIIAPFAIAGTQSAVANVRAARESVLQLAERLFEEARQQEIVSNSSDRSYRGGFVPWVSKVRKNAASGFWQTLLGDGVGNWIDAISGAASIAAAIGDGLAEVFKVGGRLAGILRGAGGILSGLEAAAGVYEAIVGFSEGDNYRGADGVISTVVGVAGVIGAIALAGTPVGWVIAGAGLAWGLASLACGDTPVTKVIWNFVNSNFEGAKNTVAEVTRGVGNFVSGLTNPFKSAFGW